MMCITEYHPTDQASSYPMTRLTYFYRAERFGHVHGKIQYTW